ncbi:MAG TPA: DUF488 family protein [Planctomycetota bacterium]|jgi:uncharacterized protein YeaO (DUF488 family)
MLKFGTLEELRNGDISRENGYVVVTMHRYPRGVRKNLMDEYQSRLAPDDQLLKDFLVEKRRLDNHNAAFAACHYEERFHLSPDALDELRRLSELSAKQDVYVICQCARNERCHRELLMILARTHFHARTQPRTFSYPKFEKRLLEAEEAVSAVARQKH